MIKDFFRSLAKKEWHVPYASKVQKVIHSFSLTEKVVFFFFVGLFCLSGVVLLWKVNKAFLVEIPAYGGSLTEGVVGSPRFVNPLLAISDIDRDLTSIIYSGLLRVSSDGLLILDLAESYTVSSDGLTYTFTIKKDAQFHDGMPVTADDVIFTIEKAKDPVLKSPRKSNWEGVIVTKISDREIQFTLKQPYSPFIQNTTLGILPKHIWKIPNSEQFPFSEYNIKAIGSGPYKIDSVSSPGGLPKDYQLVAFDKYALGESYITNLAIKSYQSEEELLDAFNNGDIESMHGLSSGKIPELDESLNKNIVSPLPRVFGVFFNQNIAPIFANMEVREALDLVINKQEIINGVLGGLGQEINEPIPPKNISQNSSQTFNEEEAITKAKEILSKKGWTLNEEGVMVKKDKKTSTPLAFSISTSDAQELKNVATILQTQWQKIGAKVDVKIFEVNDLNQNIIRPRKYDALLFGEVISRDMDLYPFWHSSQRLDPGLNIAMYTNIKADKILDSIRNTVDQEKQKELYESFNKEIKIDKPAIFLYSPYFTYIVPKKVHNITLGQLATPAERFSNISEWYIETSHVWKIFDR